jgi:hypothetical protein
MHVLYEKSWWGDKINLYMCRRHIRGNCSACVLTLPDVSCMYGPRHGMVVDSKVEKLDSPAFSSRASPFTLQLGELGNRRPRSWLGQDWPQYTTKGPLLFCSGTRIMPTRDCSKIKRRHSSSDNRFCPDETNRGEGLLPRQEMSSRRYLAGGYRCSRVEGRHDVTPAQFKSFGVV